MRFDITNLELECVLVALHTAARVNNVTFLANKVPTLTHRMARELIEEAQAKGELRFDRLMGRALHIDLNDDLVDLTRYAINNGHLTGVQALYKLCSSQDLVPLVYLDEQEEPVVVTDEWLQRYDAILNDDVRFAYPTGEADKSAWHARWVAATPEERNRMLHDDEVKYAYPHMSETQKACRTKRPDTEVVLSRSERMELLLLADENAVRRMRGLEDHPDSDLLGVSRNPDHNLQMAPRMIDGKLVGIDVVRDSASDFDGSVDMSKPVNKGFGA